MNLAQTAVLMAVSCASAQQQAPVPQAPTVDQLGRRAYAHCKHLVALGPRVSGSKARLRAADYIVARLKALGLEPIREPWRDEREKLDFENIRVRLPGRSKKVLLLGTHYDTKRKLSAPPPPGKRFDGANDGGSGSGLLLALAEELVNARQERASLELVWLDGEESILPAWDMQRALFGSREFVRQHVHKKPHPYGAFVLLDMVGSRNLAIDRDRSSSQKLVPPFAAAAKKLGYSANFFAKTTEVDDDHVPFHKAGLPALDLIQFEQNPTWHTYEDTMAHISAKSLGIVGRVVLAAMPEVERAFLR